MKKLKNKIGDTVKNVTFFNGRVGGSNNQKKKLKNST